MFTFSPENISAERETRLLRKEHTHSARPSFSSVHRSDLPDACPVWEQGGCVCFQAVHTRSLCGVSPPACVFARVCVCACLPAALLK